MSRPRPYWLATCTCFSS